MDIYSRFDRAIEALKALRDNIGVSNPNSAHGLRDKDRLSDKIVAMETAQGLLSTGSDDGGRLDLEDIRYLLMGFLEYMHTLGPKDSDEYEGIRQGYDLALSYVEEEIQFNAALEREF